MSIVISPITSSVLSNFLEINKSIYIKPGNKLSTLSINKNIMAEFISEEEFDREIPIYDLGDLMTAIRITTSKSAGGDGRTLLDLSNPNCLVVSNESGSQKTRIYYSDPDLIISAPEKEFTLPAPDVKFHLSVEALSQLKFASSSYGVPDLCVYGVDGQMHICVTDKKNETSNTFSIELGEVAEDDFCYCFKQENIKLYGIQHFNKDFVGGYDVSIHGGKVALFESKKLQLRYWIALEPNTTK